MKRHPVNLCHVELEYKSNRHFVPKKIYNIPLIGEDEDNVLDLFWDYNKKVIEKRIRPGKAVPKYNILRVEKLGFLTLTNWKR